jgi:hypothetical protein
LKKGGANAHTINQTTTFRRFQMKTQQILAALLLVAGGAAMAQTPAPVAPSTPRVDQRQENQQQRIDKGVASGQLTPREAARMDRQQGRVASSEALAKSDGVVTKKERARLAHQQNKTSRHIRHQKHDRQHVAPAT